MRCVVMHWSLDVGKAHASFDCTIQTHLYWTHGYNKMQLHPLPSIERFWIQYVSDLHHESSIPSALLYTILVPNWCVYFFKLSTGMLDTETCFNVFTYTTKCLYHPCPKLGFAGYMYFKQHTVYTNTISRNLSFDATFRSDILNSCNTQVKV